MAGSVLVGVASDGSPVDGVRPWMAGGTIGALEAVVVEPPDEPEPPVSTPDYAVIIELLERNLAQLIEAGSGILSAVEETDALIGRLRESLGE